jgi:eukaryotic-like serine/threonine-protein kinase
MDLREQLQRTLGDAYTLERELGGGGMSRVFVAEEVRLKRKVVVKVLSPELAQGLSVGRFEREIQTAAALQQANIVPVLTAGDTNGLPFFTMPFVEGESLRARLARGVLPIGEVISVLRDVARALAYAHSRNFVHRDIKPDNVLLSGGTAVVTDFGIAKAISASRTASAGATLTQIGTSIGTPAYMAPEQAAGDPDVDYRADIYSLGCLAFELLAGQPPFANRTPQRMLAAHMGEAPRPVTEFRPDTPAALAELVMSCLAKEAKDRPQSAADVARVLETITSGSGMQTVPGLLLGGPAMFRKALAIYAGAFVAVAVLAKAAIVGIGLPAWVLPGSLIVMALGLPVVLFTGYAQRVARRAITATPTYTPGGTPGTTAHGTIATMAMRASPHLSWYRTAKGGAYAMGAFVLLIGAFMLMRVLGIGPAGTLMAAGKLKQREPLLITDFRVTNTDSSLGRVVSDAVRAGLGQSSVISLVSPAGTAAALRRMERPGDVHVTLPIARELAARDGIKAIVDGDVTSVGGGYIVVLRLVTADSGTELWSARETGDGPRGLIDAADKLARELRAKAGESLRSVQASAPLAQVTSASLEALRKYSEGVRYHDVTSDWPNAIAKFREAVALDSTFAMAWRKLGAALGNAGRPRVESNAALEQAHRHRDHLTENERDFEEAYYYLQGPGGDRAKGIALYESGLRRGDSTPASNLALEYLTRREFARSESLFAISKRANSGQGLAWYEIAWAQADQGHWKEAEASLADAKRRFPDNSLAPFTEALLLYNSGRLDSLQRLLDVVSTRGRIDLRATAISHSADLALVRGRFAESMKLRAAASRSAAGTSGMGVVETPAADSAAVTRMEIATLGASPRGVQRMDATLARSPLRALNAEDRPYFSVAIAYARAGRPDRARAILGEYERDVRDTTLKRRLEYRLHGTLGEIALAENRTADAIAEFRRADVSPDGPSHECPICLPINLARAFDAGRQRDSAIVMYERYLSTPYMERISTELFEDFVDPLDPIFLPGVHRRLGELYEESGNATKAIEHYRPFVELWKNADAELQPKVDAVRAKLKKLADVEPRAKKP